MIFHCVGKDAIVYNMVEWSEVGTSESSGSSASSVVQLKDEPDEVLKNFMITVTLVRMQMIK